MTAPSRTPDQGTPIDVGIIERVKRGVRYIISGDQTANFGPGQPLAPLGQDAQGRQFDYPVYYNQQQQPRSYEPIGFETLRNFADAEYLTRLAIEKRKDQFGKLKWQIVRDDGGPPDAMCQTITDFLREPDRDHDYLTWKRMLLEDLLVLDAPAVYFRRTKGGGLYSADLIDGATIARKLYTDGRTPQAPDVAYQQIIKGLPYVDYSKDQLLYQPRNPRTNRVYGYSPVQQIILMLQIALRREVSQLQFYTEGNVPDMIIATPNTWSATQIKDAQILYDNLLAGDTGARRRMRFVPGDSKPMELKPGSTLFDAFDEWIARIVSSAFNQAPSPYVKQQNRATQQTAQEVALEEGLSPLMEWDLIFMKRLITKGFQVVGYSFSYIDEPDIDPLVQAQIEQIELGGPTGQGVKTRSVQEIRDDHDWGPAPAELTEMNAPPPTPEPLQDGDKPPTEAPETTEKLAKISTQLERISVVPAPQALPSITVNTPAQRAPNVNVEVRPSRRAGMRKVVGKRNAAGEIEIHVGDAKDERRMIATRNAETGAIEMAWVNERVSAL